MSKYDQLSDLDKEGIERFREYLRIKSVHPTPDYAGVVEFLRKYAALLDAPLTVEEIVPGKPIVVITIRGEDDSLSSILINSHTDVVPVEEKHWTVPAFEACMDEEGRIFGRGAQDMKGSTIMWLEGFLRLRREGKKFLRTIHFSFVPDEEIGGVDGMAKWVNEPSFAALRVGLALDEGLASGSDDSALVVFYGERAPWWVEVKAEGPTGHGSRFVENPATHRLLRTVAKFLSYRDTEEARLEAGKSCGATLGDVTTINLTVLSAGNAVNVVPSQATAAFDIRIPPHVDLVAFRALLDEWTSEEGVSYRFIQHTPANPCTQLSDDNVWWQVFQSTCTRMGEKLRAEVFPAATDSRYLRLKGLPALGFSPMAQTPILLHDHNEFLHIDVLVRGFSLTYSVIQDLANTPPLPSGN